MMSTDASSAPPPQQVLPPPPPAALSSGNPGAWLSLFGPGAIIASLTIGTGELIFSSRGGAIFGYRILALFLAICILKWILVFSTARHMVLTGVHPFGRWIDFPFLRRGLLPTVLFLFAAVCIPIWVSFHSSVLGDLAAGLTGTKHLLNGATVHLWGAAILVGVFALALSGGYAALERVQLAIVGALLVAVAGTLFLLRPDWIELVFSAIVPQRLEYPQWLLEDPRPEMQRIAARPVWIETTLYVGVIGGASYDYLAYTSFLRDKRWGLAGSQNWDGDPQQLTDDAARQLRGWIRAPLIDCTLSFLVVMAFSAVFVASGALVLGPRRELPGDANFLEHQARFVTELHPGLYPLYVAGACLAMLGTLYGTLEIAPIVLREMAIAARGNRVEHDSQEYRRLALIWCVLIGLLVLIVSFVNQISSGEPKPAGLTNLLIPASLFTGVLSCGLICLLNVWMDRRLPRSLRPASLLVVGNAVAGILFVLLGIKGYWDHSGVLSLAILLGTLAVGWLVAPTVLRIFARDAR